METTELGFTVLPKGYEVASQTGRTFASANKRTVPIGKFFCKHLANDEGNAPFNPQKSSILTAEQQTDLFHGRFKEAVQLCDECYRNYNAFTAGGYEGLRKQVELEKLADETPAGSAAGIEITAVVNSTAEAAMLTNPNADGAKGTIDGQGITLSVQNMPKALQDLLETIAKLEARIVQLERKAK